MEHVPLDHERLILKWLGLSVFGAQPSVLSAKQAGVSNLVGQLKDSGLLKKGAKGIRGLLLPNRTWVSQGRSLTRELDKAE